MNLLPAPARLYVEGVAVWSQRLPGWERARHVLAGLEPAPEHPVPRPTPELLPPTERRRAPDTVAVAIEAAQQACAAAGRDPASLTCVFTSMHGDLAITDYMCATIAATPRLISPTKFHNSVHNAAAGYWSIGTGCTRPYTALSAGIFSFGAGLLEASVQALTSREPILLVAYDIDARGPLAPMANSKHILSVAFVLNAEHDPRATARLDLQMVAQPGLIATRALPANELLVAGNSNESCLPLLEALARGGEREVLCLATLTLGLSMRVGSPPS